MATNHAIEVGHFLLPPPLRNLALIGDLQYSRSSRAKCKGLPPCNGSSIDLGVLRYGATAFGEYGETVEWRHWYVFEM
jgi:hypothetical protein